MDKLGKGVGFERIRRITGYLVGTIDRWNNAKKAEEKDRVKHQIASPGKLVATILQSDCNCKDL